MKLFLRAVVVFLAVAGCDSVSSDKIQLWKTTEKGTARLQDAVKNRAVEPRLRAEAVVALVDMDLGGEVDVILADLPMTDGLHNGPT